MAAVEFSPQASLLERQVQSLIFSLAAPSDVVESIPATTVNSAASACRRLSLLPDLYRYLSYDRTTDKVIAVATREPQPVAITSLVSVPGGGYTFLLGAAELAVIVLHMY